MKIGTGIYLLLEKRCYLCCNDSLQYSIPILKVLFYASNKNNAWRDLCIDGFYLHENSLEQTQIFLKIKHIPETLYNKLSVLMIMTLLTEVVYQVK